jgi:hypothetical protein
MRRALLTGFALFLVACSTGGYRILSGTRATAPSVGAGVILYDAEGEGHPPPGCRVLGQVSAWSPGEKSFPSDQLRAAAAELGGDSVIDIRPDPAETDRHRATHLGTVARCRS